MIIDGHNIIKCDFLDEEAVLQLNEMNKNKSNLINVVEVENTKKIDPNALKILDENIKIRIVGPFTENYMNKYPSRKIKAFYNSLYERDELIHIIKKLETIESRIDPTWSQMDKMVYFTDTITRNIWYDPEYLIIKNHGGQQPEQISGKQTKCDYENRTLRGLLKRKTVCAGYSLIFKEIMNRNDMRCRYISGKTDSGGGHAWNIVEIDGKAYPIDITQKNRKIRQGDPDDFDYITCDLQSFVSTHIPNKEEKIPNLSQISKQEVEKSYSRIKTRGNNTPFTRIITRLDGTSFGITQIGIEKGCSKYIYWDIDENGKYGLPKLLYSEENLINEEQEYKFERKDAADYDDFTKAFNNLLFSMKNIENSQDEETKYLGRIRKNQDGKYEIIKRDKLKEAFQMDNIRRKVREDGSIVVVIRNETKTPFSEKYVYQVYSIVPKADKPKSTHYEYYSDEDLFAQKGKDVVNGVLSIENLEKYSSGK